MSLLAWYSYSDLQANETFYRSNILSSSANLINQLPVVTNLKQIKFICMNRP